MNGGAIIIGDYRYLLTRRWGEGPSCLFVMLNPSTADETEDDPTIRRCVGFAQREGCGSLDVVNLFAYRATSPKDMKSARDPVGRHNDTYITDAVARTTGPVIAAWGNHGSFRGRGNQVRHLLTKNAVVQVFGLTKAGEPMHPLYQPANQPLGWLEE